MKPPGSMEKPLGGCFAGLNNRCIPANRYQVAAGSFQQTCSGDQTVALVRHLDQLSTTLQRANEEATWLSDMITVKYIKCGGVDAASPPPFENIRRLTVHRMLTDGAAGPLSVNGDWPPAGIGVQADGGGGGSSAPPPRSDDDDDDRRQPSSWTTTGTGGTASSSITDSKGQSKMLKLCLMLKNNIAELGALYDRRRQLGYAYTDAEKTAMGPNLRALETDVMRLMKAIEECRHRGRSRDPTELRCIVDAYKRYESQYRALRTMNKMAKKRNEPCGVSGGGGGKCKTVDRVGGEPKRQSEDCADDFTVKSVIEKYVCRPCYNLYRNSTGKK